MIKRVVLDSLCCLELCEDFNPIRVGKVTGEIKKNVFLGKKSHFSKEIAENPTLRVGVEWVSKVKNTHVKPQKSLKSHPTRGSFQHPLCSDPRVGLSLVRMFVGLCSVRAFGGSL